MFLCTLQDFYINILLFSFSNDCLSVNLGRREASREISRRELINQEIKLIININMGDIQGGEKEK